MSNLTVIPDVTAVKDLVGKPLGPSDWIEVTQERINFFADATDDHQWIHTDPERARRESPFGGPIAHGFLTMALAPTLLSQVLRVEGNPTILNTGISRMKLSAPVRAGSRLRLSCEIARARNMPSGGMHAVFKVAIHVEGTDKPALTAELGVVYAPRAGREGPA